MAKRLRIAFDLDETLGVPLIDGAAMVGWHARAGCVELLRQLRRDCSLCLWSVSSRRYVTKALSFGLGVWFEDVYTWDEIPERWKDVRRIGADLLVDDSPHHREAAAQFGLTDAYIIVPAYGSPEDVAEPLKWIQLVTTKVNAGMDKPQSPKPILGLIGGIGSGKSLVSGEFAKHGGLLISGDQLGHEALRQPEIMARVIERWGQDVVAADGSINRRALGRKVFADAKERKALETIVFPHIERRIREQIAGAQGAPDVKFVVLDAAIMLEAGWNNVCDSLVYVDVPRDIRLQRLASQRGWDEKEVAAREAAQMPLTEKQQRADFTLDNSGSPEHTLRQVERLLSDLHLKSVEP